MDDKSVDEILDENEEFITECVRFVMGGGEGSCSTAASMFRHGIPLAFVYEPEAGRELSIAALARFGIGADHLLMVTKCYVAKRSTEELTAPTSPALTNQRQQPYVESAMVVVTNLRDRFMTQAISHSTQPGGVATWFPVAADRHILASRALFALRGAGHKQLADEWFKVVGVPIRSDSADEGEAAAREDVRALQAFPWGPSSRFYAAARKYSDRWSILVDNLGERSVVAPAD